MVLVTTTFCFINFRQISKTKLQILNKLKLYFVKALKILIVLLCFLGSRKYIYKLKVYL